ncbi:MAG: hypothetical protein NTU98_04920 [Bacteroidetes bacterium]|nr:hypothetical protein [Bacteroidota bacterium]
MSSVRYFFLALSFLAFAGYASGKTAQGASTGSPVTAPHQISKGRITLPEIRTANSLSGFDVLNPGMLVLDSVYGSNWVSSSWALSSKTYQTRNSHGLVVQSLLKRYNSSSGQFENYGRILYNYSGSSPDIVSDSTQLWFTNYWITLQYNHYLSKDTPDESFSKEWNPVKHKFISGTRTTYQYNDSLLPAEVVTQSWDTITQDWMNTFRTTYAYTALMQPQEQIVYSWKSSSLTWVYSSKSTDVYDGTNALVGHMEYFWNDISLTWVNTTRIYYHNTPASMPDTSVLESWNIPQSRWDSVETSIYTYNQFNWLMNVRTYKINDMTGNWYHSYQMYYTYFPNTGYEKSETGNVWDTLHLAYITDHYMEVDSVDQLLEKYDLYINLGTFQIVGGSWDLYVYSSTSDTLSKGNQEWNLLTSTWQNKTQKLFTYDAHNLLTEDLVQDWVSASSVWENSKKSDYYYSDFIGITEHPDNNKLCFFANPVTAGSSINCSGLTTGNNYYLTLNSLQGNEVFRTEFRGGETVTISGSLAPGLYILIVGDKESILEKERIVLLR